MILRLISGGVRRECRGVGGFTFIELMVAVVIMVFLFSTVNAIFSSYFAHSRRLAAMSTSNQAIERLTSAIRRDSRSAATFIIDRDGRRLVMECAIDEAFISGSSFVENDMMARYTQKSGSDERWEELLGEDTNYDTNYYGTNVDDLTDQASSLGDVAGISVVDGAWGQSNNYFVAYEYVEETSYIIPSMGWEPPSSRNSILVGKGIARIAEGTLIRNGPIPDPEYGLVTPARKEAFDSTFDRPSLVVSSGWAEGTNQWGNVEPVFTYYPRGATWKTATGVTIRLSRRINYRNEETGLPYRIQTFSNTVVSRVKK